MLARDDGVSTVVGSVLVVGIVTVAMSSALVWMAATFQVGPEASSLVGVEDHPREVDGVSGSVVEVVAVSSSLEGARLAVDLGPRGVVEGLAVEEGVGVWVPCAWGVESARVVVWTSRVDQVWNRQVVGDVELGGCEASPSQGEGSGGAEGDESGEDVAGVDTVEACLLDEDVEAGGYEVAVCVLGPSGSSVTVG